MPGDENEAGVADLPLLDRTPGSRIFRTRRVRFKRNSQDGSWRWAREATQPSMGFSAIDIHGSRLR